MRNWLLSSAAIDYQTHISVGCLLENEFTGTTIYTPTCEAKRAYANAICAGFKALTDPQSLPDQRVTKPYDRNQVGQCERYIVIGADHNRAIVTLVDRNCGFTMFSKVLNKSALLAAMPWTPSSSPQNYR